MHAARPRVALHDDGDARRRRGRHDDSDRLSTGVAGAETDGANREDRRADGGRAQCDRGVLDRGDERDAAHVRGAADGVRKLPPVSADNRWLRDFESRGGRVDVHAGIASHTGRLLREHCGGRVRPDRADFAGVLHGSRDGERRRSMN